MKISQNRDRLSIILAMALLFWVGSAAAQEQRCDELGSVCTCSEPLDTDSFAGSGSDYLANPTDTNSKQCDGGRGLSIAVNTSELPYLKPTPETGMPAGNTVKYVFRKTIGYNNFEGIGSHTLNSSTNRLCYRHYFRLSPDYSGGAQSCDAGKFMQFKFTTLPNAPGIQVGSGGGHHDYGFPPKLALYWPPQWSGTNIPSQGPFAYSDCYGEWCRAEVCVSGNFAAGTGDFFVEGYMLRVSDGKRLDWPRFDIGPNQVGGNMLQMGLPEIMEGWRGADPLGCASGGASNFSSWREASHIMEAQWTTDTPGKFIGPAYEIEVAGGSLPATSGAPTPTPGPAPSPAPGQGSIQTGVFALQASGIVSGAQAIVTSTVTAGVGPYQFLFDCGNVGYWQGVIDTSSASAQYTCPLSGQSSIAVRAVVWDKSTNAVDNKIVTISTTTANSALGTPGTPGLVSP